ncbi:trehalose-phosphatase [Marilutibacter chinensis]|uniref:Trehalose 6-phosphate phosphatase n=1 Tax=Marilutibacter chinensis TaxID=2912247 RepID=A0ABS9HUQ6_9GAMM|nr:trehalose-phosphatase [Lysobacter chinensis]MCF7222398.1 trehalose-phosphatase [Lysobacter chinensis]
MESFTIGENFSFQGKCFLQAMPADRMASEQSFIGGERRDAYDGEVMTRPIRNPMHAVRTGAAAELQAPPLLTREVALFLDVDGCLLEIRDDPALVRAEAPLIELLEAISEKLEGALALVSGRSIASIDRIFAPATFAAAGLHGLERRGAASRPVLTLAPEANPMLRDVVAEARSMLARHPGALIEDKGATVALHWRVAPEAENVARSIAGRALDKLPDYEIQHGKQVLEIRPAGDDKGTAIAAFLEAYPFRGRMPVFAGDDVTDEHGFEIVNRLSGVSVLVGDRTETSARYRLESPATVRAWLENIQ